MSETEDEIVSRMVAKATEAGRLGAVYEAFPTKENGVRHAVAVWRMGCTNETPGECEECNELFLKVLRERLEAQ